MYAKHLASRQYHAGSPESAAASEVAPILAADLEYSPPPAWPVETSEPSATEFHDDQVVAASHEEHVVAATPPGDQRRVFTPSSRAERNPHGDKSTRPSFPQLPGLPMGAVVTTIGATSTVAGLFLLSIYVVRRGMPRGTAVLPDDVVCVLGRKQLSARQSAQLIRIGNKLVLLSVTPDGSKPLAEVTDPVEVDRLLGLCHQSSDASSTAEFQDVMERLSREHSSSGFLGNPSLAGSAYATHGGGRGNG